MAVCASGDGLIFKLYQGVSAATTVDVGTPRAWAQVTAPEDTLRVSVWSGTSLIFPDTTGQASLTDSVWAILPGDKLEIDPFLLDRQTFTHLILTPASESDFTVAAN